MNMECKICKSITSHYDLVDGICQECHDHLEASAKRQRWFIEREEICPVCGEKTLPHLFRDGVCDYCYMDIVA